MIQFADKHGILPKEKPPTVSVALMSERTITANAASICGPALASIWPTNDLLSRYCVTKSEITERLLLAEDDRLISTLDLDSPEFDHYYSGPSLIYLRTPCWSLQNSHLVVTRTRQRKSVGIIMQAAPGRFFGPP
jgi:hypothetical protein